MTMTMTTAPLQHQIDAFHAQVRSQLPTDLLQVLARPIARLIQSSCGPAGRAARRRGLRGALPVLRRTDDADGDSGRGADQRETVYAITEVDQERLVLTWGRQICEPGKATVLDDEELGALSASQPWERVWRWHDASYQFALCAKGPTAMRPRIRALAAGAPSAA